jgi:hypothetical protein
LEASGFYRSRELRPLEPRNSDRESQPLISARTRGKRSRRVGNRGIGDPERKRKGLRKSRIPESKSKPSGWRGTRVTRSSVSKIRGTRHRGHSSLETTIRSGPSIGGTGVRDQAPSAFDTSGNRNFRGQETRDRISRETPRKGSQPLILVGCVAGDLGESAFGASGFPKARTLAYRNRDPRFPDAIITVNLRDACPRILKRSGFGISGFSVTRNSRQEESRNPEERRSHSHSTPVEDGCHSMPS